MQHFGVVGSGTMGSGIAQKIALEGFPVTVVDISEDALERGRQMMDRIFEESVERRILTPEKLQGIRDSISLTTDFAALADADVLVEAVFENRDVKAKVFRQLEDVVSVDALIASNTSSFPITELAKTLSAPERFVGLHYFYHPVKNRLLEVIPGEQSTRETIEAARRFCFSQGKVEILCRDSPGFVVNRFFVPWLNEAVRLLREGVASLGAIESTAKRGFRLGMGPFELMNVTGVPVAMHAANGLADYLGDFYRPDPLLVQQAGSGEWKIPASEEFSEEAFRRLLGVTWAVAATLVDEGTCTPLDVDIGAQVGLRWPKGPFALFNLTEPAEREQAVAAFTARYPDYPLPSNLKADTVWSLPAVVSEETGGVATLSLARPDKSNALNARVFADLDAELNRHRDATTIVLRGKGKNFAAGADVRFFIKSMEQGKLDEIVKFTAQAQEVLKRIDDFPGKVIVVVDGFALGGGAELMLCADVIVATPRALIGFPETGIGIYPGLGAAYRLSKRVGASLAKYLIATGKMLDGESAQAVGLVDHCLQPSEISADALSALEPRQPEELPPKWASISEFLSKNTLDKLLSDEFSEEWQQKIQKQLRSKAPIALKIAMRLIDECDALTISEEYEKELTGLKQVFSTEDAMVGLKSIGKYRPEFSGK